MSTLQRVQKVLAAVGVGSRRACETLIAQGRVRVDGTVIELGAQCDPTSSVVLVDGIRIPTNPRLQYVLLNKPAGVVTAMSDDHGRPTVAEYVRQYEARLFHVGRLDADTEGLLILTNDGDLAHRLAHPSFGVPKTYVARVEGVMTTPARRQLLTGIELEDGPARADAVTIQDRSRQQSLVKLTIHDGRNRIVRRMLAQVGHPVIHLVRTAFGPLRLGQVPSGSSRELTSAEVGQLWGAVSD